jgi:hypothetical protein
MLPAGTGRISTRVSMPSASMVDVVAAVSVLGFLELSAAFLLASVSGFFALVVSNLF